MGSTESSQTGQVEQSKDKNVDDININDIDFLIFAFIHDLERQCNHDLNTMPRDIMRLCSLFRPRFDAWDLKLKHRKIKIRFGDTTIYHNWRYRRDKKQSWQTAFGKQICTAGSKYEWQLAITKINQHTYNHWKILVGVIRNCHCSTLINWRSSASDHRYSTTKFFTSLSRAGYAFIGSKGAVTTGNMLDRMYSQHDGEVEKFEEVGDVIKVILDLNKDVNTLSFEVNGYNGGIAYKVDKNWEYRLAVSVTEGRHVQMVDSEQFINKNVNEC